MLGGIENDCIYLASLEDKLQLVRDRTRSVALGYQNGFFLWGEGGTSKSFSVEETLKELKKDYRLTNTRITGKGLFRLLRDFPDSIHLLEDAETMLGDKSTYGVLRSALWGQAGKSGEQERVVTWQTASLREEFTFSGGVIILSNQPLDNVAELRAVKTRIPTLQFAPTNSEIAAKMRAIAKLGHRHGQHELLPESCLEVAKEIIERSSRLQRNLDLRLLINTFRDRLQFENGDSETHWLDLLDSRMKEVVLPRLVATGIRAATKSSELVFVKSIEQLPPQDRLEAWVKETGKSKAALYRRLDELKDEGAVSLLTSAEKRET